MSVAAPAGPRPKLWGLVLISLVQPIAMNIILPAVPDIARDFGVETVVAQLAISFFLVGLAIGQLTLGTVSDSLGRRPVLLGGLGIFSFACLVDVFTSSVGLFLLTRLIQGVSAAAGVSMARAMIYDSYETRRVPQLIATIMFGMSIGPVMAPALGGIVTVAIGWRGAFALLAVANFLLLAIAWRVCPETLSRAAPGPARGIGAGIGILMRIRRFRLNILALASIGGIYFVIMAAIGEFGLRRFGLGTADLSLYYVLCAMGVSAGTFTSTRLARRLLHPQVAMIGLTVTAAAIAAVTGQGLHGDVGALPFYICLALAQFGLMIAVPNIVSAVMGTRLDYVGTAGGVGSCLQMAAGALSIYAFGALAGDGLLGSTMASFLTMTTMLGISAAYALIRVWRIDHGTAA